MPGIDIRKSAASFHAYKDGAFLGNIADNLAVAPNPAFSSDDTENIKNIVRDAHREIAGINRLRITALTENKTALAAYEKAGIRWCETTLER